MKNSPRPPVPCKKVKLILRRDLAEAEMIEMKTSQPNGIPDNVARILEASHSKDEKAREVSTFFESNGWDYKSKFISIYVYGEHENPTASGSHQGSFGEAFLLINTEVVKDLMLVCEEDVQNAALNAHPQKFRIFLPSQSEAERMQLLCDALAHKERNRPPEARLYREIRRSDIATWLPH